MKKLSSIGVMSVLRVSVVLGAAAGILVGLIVMLLDFVDGNYKRGIITFFMAPVLYAVMGAIVNPLMAWLYNRVAERLGGIEISLED